MDEKGRDWKEFILLSLFLLFVTVAGLVGMVNAVQGAAVGGVTRYAPSGPAPGAEFEVRLAISGEVPLVAGIVETIPEGFSFVSTPHPSEQYEVSGQEIAFAVIDETEITYRVRAPSSGEGTFSGTWIDMLSEKNGSIADTVVMVGGGGAGAIGEGYSSTPTPTPATPTTTKASRDVPVLNAGIEVTMFFEDMDISLLALKADANVSDAKVEVERVEKSAEIPDPPGISYAFLEIEVENVEDANVEGRIECKVTKGWITDNNIDVATVNLNRYDRAEGWKALPTTKTGEDNDFFYFEAETPGFSLFVITGERAVATTTTPTTVATPAATSIPTAKPSSTVTTASPVSEVPGFEAVFTAVSLLVACLLGGVFRIKGKGGGVE